MAAAIKIGLRAGVKLLAQNASSAWTIDMRTGRLVLIAADAAVAAATDRRRLLAQVIG